MRSHQKGNLSVVVLIAVLLAAGTFVPLAWRQRQAPPPREVVQDVPLPPLAQAPAPPAAAAAVPDPAAPPGTEEVDPEEAETDRGPASAKPAGPTLSFARAAGLHRTPDPLRLNSSVALVVDQTTGEVLARKNDQAVLPMASLTKLMTALVVMEARQPMDEMLTITEEDVDRMRNSRSRLRVGSTLSRHEALRLALMSSENRAAHALGRAYPGGLEKMVEAMNARARALGMHNTTYADPTGLSNRNQSTARDLALLVAEVSRHPELGALSVDREHVADLGERTLQYRNSNSLVRNSRSGWDIVVQKTGYIVEAGRCVTMAANVAGHRLIMVLLDADSNGRRTADAQKLRQWVVAQNGWQDDIVLAAAEPKSKPKRSTQKAKGSEPREKSTAVAKKGTTRKSTPKTAVAASSKKDTDGRVRQSFVAAKDDPRS